MEKLHFDPTLTTIGGVQDPTAELDIRTRLFDQTLSHNHEHFGGIDIGRIGFIFRSNEPHLYLANSLPEIADINTSHASLINYLILGSVQYLQNRHQNNQLLVAARACEASDTPTCPSDRLPTGLSAILDRKAYTLDLLAGSFMRLRSEALTPAERLKYGKWGQRASQIRIDPFGTVRGARNE